MPLRHVVRARLFIRISVLVFNAGVLGACFGLGPAMTPSPVPAGAATPSIQLAAAQKTIEAALGGGGAFTPTASPRATAAPTEEPTAPPTATAVNPTETPSPVPTETATPVPTATFTPVPTETPTPQPTETPTPVPTETPTPQPTETPTPNLGATATVMARAFATAVAATLTAQVTPTSTPNMDATFAARMATSVAATLTAQATPTPTRNHQATLVAEMATSVAATLTAQPTPTRAPDYAATQASLLATSVAATLAAQPTPTLIPAPPPQPIDNGLATELRNASRNAGVGRNYAYETDLFIDSLANRIGEFQLPGLGITTNSMTGVLRRGGVGNRINGLINQVWGGWLGDVNSMGLNAYTSDPSAANLSPLRQLVVRMIQGRQGRLIDNQQHGLYNYFNRAEEDHVWWDNVNGVIGAVNRESFQWP